MDNFTEYFSEFFSRLLNTLFGVFTNVIMRYWIFNFRIFCCSDSSKAMNDFSKEMNPLCSSQFSPDKEQAASIHSDPESFVSLADTLSCESDQNDSNDCQGGAKSTEKCCSETLRDSETFGPEEEETTKLVFKFEYQKWNCNYNEEFRGAYGESSDFVKGSDAVSASTTSKYEFMSGKSFSHFLDEPRAGNFTVKECFVHSNDAFKSGNNVSNDFEFLSSRKFLPEKCEEGVSEENLDNSTVNMFKAEHPVEPIVHNVLPEDDFICSSSDADSIISSLGEGFLSEADFGKTLEYETLGINAEENAVQTEENLEFGDERSYENFDVGYEPDDFTEEDEDIMDELGKLEEECRLEESSGKSFENKHSINSKPEQSMKPISQTLTTIDLEDSNRFDTLWEHQDLIEQLKMELKKVRATGLPTILEDSESPRIMEDLKPWKIDEKLQHGSTTNELPKFYRSYRERMRKFDILNYQKMYAIGVLQSKDPLQSFSTRKNPSPAFTNILPRGFRLSRRKQTEADPMKKFMRELYSDLEMVYVGQLCLSWEFLQWEYEKALKLWESDQYGLLRFNEVAGEFQQFQVLLQRFIENEPFLHGPRVENYARNRCAMRNLLQVPVIREDNAKEKRKFSKRESDKDAITSDMLVEILEESIRTIWRFIRADKDASGLALKGPRENRVELQDPSNSELLDEIRTDLQKKEKRLRELLRSESCILKKFKKHHEEGADQVLYFFSQVDMKLVLRILNMSRITTDQLAWCRSKLNKINFVNRRIHVEPSFLLFPTS
ncbi:unnamed protein product [Sphenostylis stenocarpa]|uniref:Ribosomal protein L34Ae n=1 Tax=Sphenostylis stenocarpa TaxID=92480 RepID=A0AA86SAS2_9FABA|nr:unnamed protein product [Sphenostylis stenocarpa]